MACIDLGDGTGWDDDKDAPCNPASDGSGSKDSWAPIPGSFGWFYNRATGETKYDQNVAANAKQDYAFAHPTSAGGGGTSSSYNVAEQGPVAAGLRQQEIDQGWKVASAQLDQKNRELDASIRADQIKLDYTKDRDRILDLRSDRAEKLANANLMDQIQSRIEANQLAQQRVISDAQQLQARFNFEAAQENARQQLSAAQLNEQARQSNIAQQRGVATDIANFSGNPGDVGKNASYLMAGSSAPISQAIATGQDARTAQSLLPLDLLLQSRDQLAKGPQQFMPTNITAPTVPIPTFQPPAQGQMPNFGGQPAAQPQGAQAPQQNYGAQFGIPTNNPSNTQLANTGYKPGGVDQFGNLQFVKAANGFFGTVDQPTLFMAGEGATPETVNIQPSQNPLGQSALGPTAQYSSALQPSSNPLGQQAIGPTAQYSGQPSASRDFLNSAFQRALGNSPWAKSGTPTPVGVSAPGTNPFLQEMAAALAAIGQGINPSLFLREAQMSAPMGISGAPSRRTR